MAKSQYYSTPFSAKILFPSASLLISIAFHLLNACYFAIPSQINVHVPIGHLIRCKSNFL